MWKGALSFGLVSIPVEMYRASRERELKFVLMHDSDHSLIRYARICKEEEKEVPWNHVVKAYESEKGKFIIMADDDFSKASQERSETIDIKQFADENEIDSIYFEKPYYLEPQRGASKAYALLVATLKKSNKVGIATYVIHNRAHLGLIKVYEDMLVLNQMRYETEIVKVSELKIPKNAASAKEMNMALELIKTMTAAFKPRQFKDTYNQELKKIIQTKVKGRKVELETPKKAPNAKVYDIMSALKASLEEKTRKRA